MENKETKIKVYLESEWKDKPIKKFNGKTWEYLTKEEMNLFIKDIKITITNE